jgi:hypothetical protein
LTDFVRELASLDVLEFTADFGAKRVRVPIGVALIASGGHEHLGYGRAVA